MIGKLNIEFIDKPESAIALGFKMVATKIGGFYLWLHLGRVVIYTAFEVLTPTIYDNYYRRNPKFLFWIW